MNQRVLLLALLLLPSAGAAQRPRGLSNRGLDSLRATTLIDSVDAEAFYRYGLGLWEKRRYDAADSAFQRALHFAPWHSGAHLALGFLPFGRGERFLFDIKRRLTADSLERYFRNSGWHIGQAFLNDPLVDLTPLRFVDEDDLIPVGGGLVCFQGFCFFLYRDDRWPPHIRKAVRQLFAGRADSAYTILTAALQTRRPDEVVPDDFIWYLGQAADRSDHPDVAADAYRELAQRASRRERGRFEIDPSVRSRDLLLMLYGLAMDRIGQRAVARAALREALLADLSNFQAHSRLADLAESYGDLEEALSERRAAILVYPEGGRVHLDLGITLLQAGRAAEARDALVEASARLPWDPGTQLFLFQAAMAVHDRVIAQHALTALELFAPRRNQEQVADARRRFAESAPP